MTYFILFVIVLAFAINWEITRQAKRKAMLKAIKTLRSQTDLMLTLRGAQADKSGTVWGRIMSPDSMTYRVVGDDRTGQIEVTCYRWGADAAVRAKHTEQVSLRLKGNAFLITDSLDLADEMSRFVCDCFIQYTPQPRLDAARSLGRDLLGAVSRWF